MLLVRNSNSMHFCFQAEIKSICLFSFSKYNCFCRPREIIAGGQWSHGTWNHHICYTWCYVRYSATLPLCLSS